MIKKLILALCVVLVVPLSIPPPAHACTPPADYDPDARMPVEQAIPRQIERAEVIFVAEAPTWEVIDYASTQQVRVIGTLQGPDLPAEVTVTGYSPGVTCPDTFPSGGQHVFFTVPTDAPDTYRVVWETEGSGLPTYASISVGSPAYDLVLSLLDQPAPQPTTQAAPSNPPPPLFLPIVFGSTLALIVVAFVVWLIRR